MNRTDESSSGSSDFFSPVSISFFQNRNHNLADSTTPSSRTPIHDNSWIGARLSPIQSFDREADPEDEEDDLEVQQKQSSVHRTLEAAPFVTERTKLLSNNVTQQQQLPMARSRSQSKIHPLWESPVGNPRRSFASVSNLSVGRVVCAVSGFHLVGMALFDTLEAYRLMRTGRSDIGRSHVWTLPFLAPPTSTLRLFGALAPDYILAAEDWRSSWYVGGILSSLFITTSVVEWILIAVAWKLIRTSAQRQGKPTEFGGTFLASCITGQLWMWVYDSTSGRTVGAAAWGTCGVLCAAGMARPGYRFELYIVCATIITLALLQRPTSSVWGATAGAFLGWALGAAGCEQAEFKDHPSSPSLTRLVTLTGTLLAIGIVGSPVLSLAFPEKSR